MHPLISLIITHKKKVIFFILLSILLWYYVPAFLMLIPFCFTQYTHTIKEKLVLLSTTTFLVWYLAPFLVFIVPTLLIVRMETPRKKVFLGILGIWLLFHYAPFFIVPFDTLSLWGHEAILQTSEGLSYIQYGVFNEQHVTAIPNSKNQASQKFGFNPMGESGWAPDHERRSSTAILDDHSVVWISVSTTTNTFSISRYKDGETKVVTTLPLLSLPEYAMAYEKHTAPSLESIQSSTNDVYKNELIVFPNNTVGWLDYMATNGDANFVTDVSLRLRKVNVDTGEVTSMEVVHIPDYNVDSKIVYDQSASPKVPDTYIYPYKVKIGDLFFFSFGSSLVVAETPPHGDIIYIDANRVIFDGYTRFDDSNVLPTYVYLDCSFDKPDACIMHKLEGELLKGLIYNPTTLATISLSEPADDVACSGCYTNVDYAAKYLRLHNGDHASTFYWSFDFLQGNTWIGSFDFSADHTLIYASIGLQTFAINPIWGTMATLDDSGYANIAYFK